jgi:aspartate aminotransferase
MPNQFLSDRLNAVKPSATLVLNQKATALKAQGRTIYNLTAGEPDFNTPDHVKEAGITAITDNETRYTAVDGTAVLKRAIIAKFKHDNDLEYSAHEISVGTGTKQVIYNGLMATLNPTDEVIIPAPFWVSYPEMVALASGMPILVPCHESTQFKLTAADLAAAITPRTKWVILNSPSNPTGQVYTESELLALAAVLRQHPHVLILSDDIYEHLVYDGATFATLPQVAPDLKDRTLICNGVGKAYAMTGWRLGYAAGPRWLIEAMATIQSQSTSNPCSISQAAAVAALTQPRTFLVNRNRIYRERRDKMVSFFNQLPGFHCLEPAGAFYIYANCQGVLGKTTPQGSTLETDLDVSAYLLDHAGVATVPGTAFGLAPYLRVSYAVAGDVLTGACGAITMAIGDLK